MSRKLRLQRRQGWRRTLRLETLEERVTMDATGCVGLEAPTILPFPNVEEPPSSIRLQRLQQLQEGSTESATQIAAAAATSPILDQNGNGRVELSELKRFVDWWNNRGEESTPEEDLSEDEPYAPDVPDYGGADDEHLNQIQAPEAWAEGITGEGVTVAVIDTGIDFRHSEFRGKIWTNDDEVPGNGRDDDGNGYVDDTHGWDFVHDDRIPQDTNGHGTHVAGLIAGARDGQGVTGAAYGAELMVLQGLDGNGAGNTRDLAEAIRYAVDNGADIVNLSLSGAYSTTVETAVAYARNHGVLVIAAAGNDGASQPGAPASLSNRYSNVISVGAVDGDGELASFSNREGNAVQISAPGVRLLSANLGGYSRMSGTSMATPLASAVAALTLQARPELSPAQLRDVIFSEAERSDEGIDVINAANTLRRVA